jgi:dephospho-CoA kinase
LARDVLERGSKGFDEVVTAFGDQILKNGDIDRPRLGEAVFKDPDKLRNLELITHPLIRAAFKAIVDKSPTDAIVINQIPLLVESKANYNFDIVITVSASEESRKKRLIKRGMSESEINRRIAAQAPESEREKIADFIIRNDGETTDLIGQVEKIWHKLQMLNKAK